MFVLHIEHRVPAFMAWKKVFDRDPVGRRKAGVRRYSVMRALDDPNYVMLVLEFDALEDAQAMLASLQVLWGRAQGPTVTAPVARIAEVVEAREP